MTSIHNKPKLLAIDAGNTRVKWGLFDKSGKMLESGTVVNTELQSMQLPSASRVIISNVAGNDIATQLKALIANMSNIIWLSAQTAACGVRNQYQIPSSLGTDRWAALIAAWQLKKAPCIVVNAGTAVTIDALTVDTSNNEGLFLGGLILPGIDLMKTSLGEATAQLPKINPANGSANSVTFFATNTAEAIQAGALNAVLGAITRMSTALQEKCGATPTIVIGGGNAQVIAEQLQLTSALGVSVVENIVLQGLYQLDYFMENELS